MRQYPGLIAGLFAFALATASGSAMADGWRGGDGGWRGGDGGWRGGDGGWRGGEGEGGGYGGYGYAPPPAAYSPYGYGSPGYYQTPPPAYYAPPIVYGRGEDDDD